MNIYIIGNTGQLGYDLQRVLSHYYTIDGGGREKFNIENTEEFLDFIKNKFDIIINCSAFHNVPLCEKEQKKAFLLNSNIPSKIAEFTFKNKIKFIHFSTDYVFDGKKRSPYIETDKPNPLNIYGKSKYEGEKEILKYNKNALILRVSGLYGKKISRVKGYNFITKIIELSKKQDSIDIVSNEILTPTYTLNIAKQIVSIIENDLNGIVHCTDNGEVSWYNFAKEVFHILNIKTKLNPINSNTITDVIRPEYSVLKNSVLIDQNIDNMLFWKESLNLYLNENIL